ncbi:hypothetical protein Hanom_Chr01g00086921 [Helianthus anomalus]
MDDFGINVLEEMVKHLGYTCYMVFYFHFKVLSLCMNLGLKKLGNYNDFECMFDHVRKGVKLL